MIDLTHMCAGLVMLQQRTTGALRLQHCAALRCRYRCEQLLLALGGSISGSPKATWYSLSPCRFLMPSSPLTTKFSFTLCRLARAVRSGTLRTQATQQRMWHTAQATCYVAVFDGHTCCQPAHHLLDGVLHYNVMAVANAHWHALLVVDVLCCQHTAKCYCAGRRVWYVLLLAACVTHLGMRYSCRSPPAACMPLSAAMS